MSGATRRDGERAVPRGEGRESILQAATELMLTERMSSVSHRSVAARANVSVALIRYHFSTRSALLLACVERLMEARHARAQSLVKRGSPDLTDLECGRLLVGAYAGPDPSDDGLAATLGCLIDSAREDESLAEYLVSRRPLVEGDIREVLSACGRELRLATMLAHAIDGALVSAIVDKQEGLLEQAAESCAAILDLAAGGGGLPSREMRHRIRF